MEKPNNMSLNEWLVKKTASQMIMPENIVKTIITHQFDSAHEALKRNNSVEIYDFGKFVFNNVKAKKQLDKFYSQEKMYRNTISSDSSSEHLKKKASIRLETILNNIKDLAPKLNNGNEEDH